MVALNVEKVEDSVVAVVPAVAEAVEEAVEEAEKILTNLNNIELRAKAVALGSTDKEIKGVDRQNTTVRKDAFVDLIISTIKGKYSNETDVVGALKAYCEPIAALAVLTAMDIDALRVIVENEGATTERGWPAHTDTSKEQLISLIIQNRLRTPESSLSLDSNIIWGGAKSGSSESLAESGLTMEPESTMEKELTLNPGTFL